MIPVSLTLQGIYSYRQSVTIDFRPLVQARLFGIFGRTGSGKSTVIEAITYAIYGETERLNKRDGRAYNMMNLRSNELLIDFEFMALHPAVAFRCVVRGQRNRKRFDDAKSYDHTAYKRQGTEWIPVTLGEVQAAVGLNYDNFRRAVIIPQGRFQDFLQLTDADRTRMMKELFDLDRFELASRVGHLEGVNNHRISHLTGKLSTYERPDPEWFAAQEVLISSQRAEGAAAAVRLEELNRKLNRLSQLGILQAELDGKRHQLEALLADAGTISALEDHLRKVVRCRSKFQATIGILLTDRQKMVELKPKLQQQLVLAESLRLKRNDVVQVFEAAEADYLHNGQRQARLDQLQHLTEQAAMQAAITETSQRLATGNDLLQQESQKVEPLRVQTEEAAKQLADARARTASFPLLAQLVQWFDELHRLQKKCDELSRETGLTENRLVALKQQQEALYQSLHQAFPALDGAMPVNEMVEAATAILSSDEKAIRLDEQHLAVQQKLQQLAGNLTDEEACPVCGSLHHPNPLSRSDLTAADNALKQRLMDLERRRQVLRHGQNELMKTAIQATVDAERLQELTLQLNEAGEALRAHQVDFTGGPEYTPADETAVRHQWTEITRWQVVQQQAEAALEVLSGTQADLGSTLARYRERIDMLGAQLTGLHDQLAQAQQRQLFAPDELQRSAASLNEEKQLVRYAILQAVEKREQAMTGKQKAHEALLQAETTGQMLDMQLKELTGQVGSRSAAVEAEAHEEGFGGIEEVIALLTAPFDQEQAARQINTHREMLAMLNARIIELTSELHAEPYSRDAHEAANQLALEASETLKTCTINLDRLQQQFRQATEQRVEIEMLQKDLEAAQLRGSNLATLSKLFKASGFVNFVSSIYLQQLVSIANKRFHVLTNRQLSMELAEGNNIVIRDFLNGGHPRSVKTLSGGQTFQASLSLALALADVVHARRPGTDNFFFLDEGFGSLDRESLQMVFDTLRTLRLENRIVGLISHVEELQQEIDAHIRVVNEDEEGSRIA